MALTRSDSGPHRDRRRRRLFSKMTKKSKLIKNELTREKTIELLNLFIEKAEVLRTSSLLTSFTSREAAQSDDDAYLITKAHSAKKRSFHSDSLDAFLLTLRFFYQNNKEISIQNISTLVDSLQVCEEQRKNFSEQRALLNSFLNRKGPIKILGDRPTYREILETVLYGYHGALSKYQRYKKWIKSPACAPLIYLEFFGILYDFTRMLTVLANNCRKIVKELDAYSSRANEVAD